MRVLGAGSWGAVVSLAQGSSAASNALEWQLFLQPRYALESIALSGALWYLPGNVIGDSNQKLPVCMSPISTNPALAYLHVLNRQCPQYFSLRSTSMLQEKH